MFPQGIGCAAPFGAHLGRVELPFLRRNIVGRAIGLGPERHYLRAVTAHIVDGEEAAAAGTAVAFFDNNSILVFTGIADASVYQWI